MQGWLRGEISTIICKLVRSAMTDARMSIVLFAKACSGLDCFRGFDKRKPRGELVQGAGVN